MTLSSVDHCFIPLAFIPFLFRDIDDLNFLRIEAGAKELDFDAWFMTDALVRSHVHVSQDVRLEYLIDLFVGSRAISSCIILFSRSLPTLPSGSLGLSAPWLPWRRTGP